MGIGIGRDDMMNSCKAAYRTDEWHGWGCEVSGGACVYLFPNSKQCAKDYGEGPDAEHCEELGND